MLPPAPEQDASLTTSTLQRRVSWRSDPLRTPRARLGGEGGRTFSWTIQTKPWRRFLSSYFLSFCNRGRRTEFIRKQIAKEPLPDPSQVSCCPCPPQAPTPPHTDLGQRDVKRCIHQGTRASRGEAGRSTDEGVCSLFLFSVALRVLARVVTQEKEIKGIQMGKETKLSSDDMILCIENHKESTKNLLGPKTNATKICRIQHQYTEISCIFICVQPMS